jgi:hypothetical protein
LLRLSPVGRPAKGGELPVIAGMNARTIYFSPVLLFIAMPLLAACTFIGVDNPALRRTIDWGAEQAVPTCVYLDDGVSRADADQLLGWWNNREAHWYKLEFVPASYEPLRREQNEFFYSQITAKLNAMRRPDRCIKQIWFVHRNFSDFIYGGAATVLGLPEVVGWTDDETRTKAWTYANATPDVNQLVISPGMAIRHEMYHMVGCDHFDLTMSHCYEAIQSFKAWEREYLAIHSMIDVAKAEGPGGFTTEDGGVQSQK